MTGEERIDWLCRLRSNIQCYMDVATLSDDVRKNFVQVLTEVIEQEPCEKSMNKAYEFGNHKGVGTYWNQQTDTVELPRAVFEYILRQVPTEEQEPKKLNCTLEDFKQFALENNYALLTTELYSQMITEREWISPKDKLPDNMTRVLVTIKTRSRIAVRSGTYYDGHFSLDNGDCWLTRDKEVRGWMKCPEPYERGGK